MTATDTAVQLAQVAGHAAADKLATDIVLIDVSERLAITDVFVIATGNNERQVEAIVDAIEEKLRLVGSKPLRREGKRDGRWVLLDYSEIVVHIQHAEERVFYALERLWRDCPVINFDPMAAAPVVVARPDGGPAAANGGPAVTGKPAADGDTDADGDDGSEGAAAEPDAADLRPDAADLRPDDADAEPDAAGAADEA